jgi:hypothetical protein
MQSIQPNPRRKATPLWKQDVVASSMNKVMCKCGAFYDFFVANPETRIDGPE